MVQIFSFLKTKEKFVPICSCLLQSASQPVSQSVHSITFLQASLCLSFSLDLSLSLSISSSRGQFDLALSTYTFTHVIHYKLNFSSFVPQNMSHSKQVLQPTNMDRNETAVDPSIEPNDTRIANVSNDTNTPPSSSSSSPLLQLTKNENLLEALAKQMNYYFSKQNLAQDTYLNTIMNLNSGYVPITILGGFANINRIIARFAAEANVDMTLLDPLFVMSLLRQSVLYAEELEVVMLDQSGKVVVSQQDHEQQEQTQQQQQQRQLQLEQQQEEGMDKHKKSPIVFEAIGRSSIYNNSKNDHHHHVHNSDGRVIVDRNAVDATKEDAMSMDAKDEPRKEKDFTEHSTRSSTTVILRDVSNDATEQDVRAVFEREGDSSDATCPIMITKIQKEVGQCWFVTLDATTSKQDMVSILLNLRNKKLCNEPIKARLKTSSTATTTRETYGQVSEISSYNTYRNSDVSQAGKIYSGDRVNYSFRDSSKPFSKARGAKGTEYHGFHKKGYSFEGRKVYKSDAKKSSPTSSSSSSSSPPPPLVDEHFPGLAGSARKEGVEESIKNGEKEMPKEMSNSITGYAAALLKAAPPVTEVSTKVIQKSSTEVRKTSEAKKVEDVNSSGTVSTEGSSADDKSHTSKSETESSSPVVAPVAVKSWGGGRSFADVLKKQEK